MALIFPEAASTKISLKYEKSRFSLQNVFVSNLKVKIWISTLKLTPVVNFSSIELEFGPEQKIFKFRLFGAKFKYDVILTSQLVVSR